MHSAAWGFYMQMDLALKKTVDKAFALYIKAAEQGDEVAQCNVGYYYDNGISVDLDPVKANEWYEKSANQGFAISQYNLAWNLERGIGAKQDYKKGICAIRKTQLSRDMHLRNFVLLTPIIMAMG